MQLALWKLPIKKEPDGLTYKQRQAKAQRKYRTKAHPTYFINDKAKRDRIREIITGRKKPECCDSCGRADNRICFDHNHKTGQFRGYLCDRCNKILGFVDESKSVLEKLLNYLDLDGCF